MSCRFILAIFFCMLLFSSTSAHAWEAVIIRVVDGDTLLVAPKTAKYPEQNCIDVRLYGIDAPELHQPGGQESKEALVHMTSPGKIVEIIPIENDRYDRIAGLVMVDGLSVNAAQIELGQAWLYKKYCRARICQQWEHAEMQARNAEIGLWREKAPIQPWEWRKR